MRLEFTPRSVLGLRNEALCVGEEMECIRSGPECDSGCILVFLIAFNQNWSTWESAFRFSFIQNAIALFHTTGVPGRQGTDFKHPMTCMVWNLRVRYRTVLTQTTKHDHVLPVNISSDTTSCWNRESVLSTKSASFKSQQTE